MLSNDPRLSYCLQGWVTVCQHHMTTEKNKGGNCAWFQLACWGETAALNEWDKKLKDEGNVPASPFSRSVKALNWFWSSETKFGTRLKICNACFAVFWAHKADLQQLRLFVKFLTTSDLQHIAVSVSDAGEVGAMRKMPQAPSSSYRKVIGRFQNVHKKKVLKWHPGKISRGHSALHAAAGCLQSTRQGPRGQLTSLCSSKWILPRHRRDPGMA